MFLTFMNMSKITIWQCKVIYSLHIDLTPSLQVWHCPIFDVFKRYIVILSFTDLTINVYVKFAIKNIHQWMMKGHFAVNIHKLQTQYEYKPCLKYSFTINLLNSTNLMRHNFFPILTLYYIAINLEIRDFEISDKFLDTSIASHEVLLYIWQTTV